MCKSMSCRGIIGAIIIFQEDHLDSDETEADWSTSRMIDSAQQLPLPL
jgi:hypothetical protein